MAARSGLSDGVTLMILKLHFKLTLHCDPELFLRELGSTPDATPEPIRAPRTAGLTAGQLLRATEWLHQNLSEDHDLRWRRPG